MRGLDKTQEMWDRSANAWIASVEKDLQRQVLLDPLVLAIPKTARGRDALDVGCGEGRFCRILQGLGFATTGLDPTEAFISQARKLDPEGEYVQAGAEDMPFEDGAFDLVVSYLTLIDITDYRAAIGEMARVLRSGGLLAVVNLTPIVTANPEGWVKDDEGRKVSWPIDDYLTERANVAAWNGIEVVNYHRPLSAYFEAFLAAGFRLERYLEATPDAEMLARYPSMAEHFRVPWFNVMAWRKE